MATTDRILGLINLMEVDYQMRSLTAHRPLAAVPYGGRYRIIDFALSNMASAGIDTIGIYTKDKERSLMDHIRSGRPWDMDRMSGGIFYFAPTNNPVGTYDAKGDIHNFYENMDLLDKAHSEYVLMTGSAMVMNIDFNKLLEAHKESGADVTVVYKNAEAKDHAFDHAYVVNTDEGERIKSFGTKIVKREESQPGETSKISAEIYLLKTSLFREMVEDAVSDGSFNYIRDVLHDGARIYRYQGYEYKGYMAFVSSIRTFFKANMDLLNEDNLMDLFYGANQISTKIRNENPSFYGKESKVENSLIANGCVIEGEVVNSILFRRVKVAKGARIENSIIMQNGDIKENVELKNIIADKNVVIKPSQTLTGTISHPLVLVKDSII